MICGRKIAVLVGTLFVVADGLPQAAGAAEYKFLLMGALVHPVYAPMPGAIEDAARKYDISPVPVFTMPQKFDVVEQNAIIDSHVAQGFNGFAFQPDDPVASNQKMQELKDIGIPSLSIGGCPVEPSPSLFCLATDTEELAYQGAKNLIAAMDGKGNIVHFTGQPEDTNTTNSINGVARAVAEHPDILRHGYAPTATLNVLAAQSRFASSPSGIAMMSSWLRKNGDRASRPIGLNNFAVISRNPRRLRRNDGTSWHYPQPTR